MAQITPDTYGSYLKVNPATVVDWQTVPLEYGSYLKVNPATVVDWQTVPLEYGSYLKVERYVFGSVGHRHIGLIRGARGVG